MRIDPAEIRYVVGETLELPAERPDAWRSGVAVRGVRVGVRGQDVTPAPGAIDPASVRAHGSAEYFLDPEWGTLGAATECTATVDYRYSLLRVDSVLSDGTVVRGRSELTGPRPPALPTGVTAEANVFVPYFCDGSDYRVFPIGEPSPVDSRPASSQPGRIVCWGDSVTDGGDSSSTETAYPAVLQRLLGVEVIPVAVGGSTSVQWLNRANGCDWDRVAAAEPDLVTVEFVNDAGLPAWDSLYREIVRRIRSIGAEPVLTTPHFTMPAMMGLRDIRAADPRPYTHFLREFAAAEGIALAAISARWEQLAELGLPYVTLLANGINHPDDRGHFLAAEELARCIAKTPPES